MILKYERYCALKTLIQIVGEGLVIFGAAILIFAWQTAPTGPVDSSTSPYTFAVLFTLICQAIIYWCGLYNPTLSFGLAAQAIGMVQALAIGTVIFATATLLIGKKITPLAWVAGFAALLAAVLIWRAVIQIAAKADIFRQKIIMLGTQGRIREIYQSILPHIKSSEATDRKPRPCNLRIVCVADTPQDATCSFPLAPETPYVALEDCKRVVQLACDYKTRQVVVCKRLAGTLSAQEIYELKRQGIQLCPEETMLEAISGRREPAELDAREIIFSKSFQRSLQHLTKRLGDTIAAFTLLVLLFPLLLAVSLVLKALKPGRVLKTDTCLGLRKKMFTRYRYYAPETSSNNPFHHRRIQALPRLWNVLIGDMSLVGPYPVGPQQAEDIGQDQPLFDERFTVRPGITGWAQVNHRCDGSKKSTMHMLGYDLFYLKHMSLFLDIVIAARALLIQVPANTPVSNES